MCKRFTAILLQIYIQLHNTGLVAFHLPHLVLLHLGQGNLTAFWKNSLTYFSQAIRLVESVLENYCIPINSCRVTRISLWKYDSKLAYGSLMQALYTIQTRKRTALSLLECGQVQCCT
ncbi:hypothetical protein T05_6090 [Trichinella murrelli]|uniref:Uncharacterized protein n=1 Tax=Trichinella murrelli TaxID=144512 RepID=A0A0V0T5D8_9BILA|nr:hypothetical protein T05_6090 [Trichinella murrelli]